MSLMMGRAAHLGLFWLLAAGLGLLVASVPASATPSLNFPTWEPAPPGQQIAAGSPFGAGQPTVRRAPDGHLMVAFDRHTSASVTGDPDPYYSLSLDNGLSWSAPAPIYVSPDAGTDSIQVAVAFDEASQAHAVWVEDLALVYAGQASWPGIEATLSLAGDVPGAAQPDIVASRDNTLDVVWAEGNPFTFDIFHSRSSDGGQNWTTAAPVQATLANSEQPDLAVDDAGNLHLVWEEKVGNQSQGIFYSQGSVAGNSITWSPPVTVSGQISGTHRPLVSVDGGAVDVFFTVQWDNNTQWVYRAQCFAGCTAAGLWQAAIPVSGQAVGVNDIDPSVLVGDLAQAGGCTYLYFHGTEPAGPPPASEDEIIRGVDSCDGWGDAARQEVTLTGGRALNPVLDTDGSWLHLVYERVEGGERQVYYFRGQVPASGSVPLFLPLLRSN